MSQVQKKRDEIQLEDDKNLNKSISLQSNKKSYSSTFMSYLNPLSYAKPAKKPE